MPIQIQLAAPIATDGTANLKRDATIQDGASDGASDFQDIFAALNSGAFKAGVAHVAGQNDGMVEGEATDQDDLQVPELEANFDSELVPDNLEPDEERLTAEPETTRLVTISAHVMDKPSLAGEAGSAKQDAHPADEAVLDGSKKQQAHWMAHILHAEAKQTGSAAPTIAQTETSSRLADRTRDLPEAAMITEKSTLSSSMSKDTGATLSGRPAFPSAMVAATHHNDALSGGVPFKSKAAPSPDLFPNTESRVTALDGQRSLNPATSQTRTETILSDGSKVAALSSSGKDDSMPGSVPVSLPKLEKQTEPTAMPNYVGGRQSSTEFKSDLNPVAPLSVSGKTDVSTLRSNDPSVRNASMQKLMQDPFTREDGMTGTLRDVARDLIGKETAHLAPAPISAATRPLEGAEVRLAPFPNKAVNTGPRMRSDTAIATLGQAFNAVDHTTGMLSTEMGFDPQALVAPTQDGLQQGNRTVSPHPLTNDATNRPEVARHVATQLVAVLPRAADRPIELTLSPEELGRVRISLHATDHGITMNVQTERPETQDLLRRHIDQLAQEFRNLGYGSINFAFGQQGAGAKGGKPITAIETSETDDTQIAPVDQPAPTPKPAQQGSLDLRL